MFDHLAAAAAAAADDAAAAVAAAAAEELGSSIALEGCSKFISDSSKNLKKKIEVVV